jgi:signal transduction histidine kinase
MVGGAVPGEVRSGDHLQEARDGEGECGQGPSFVLFRCVQELLVNVTKHAQAKHVLVWMKKNGRKFEVGVEDDGRGFDVRKIKSPADWTQGFGLFSIGERLNYLGGQFTIKSTPGKGTRAWMAMRSGTRRRDRRGKGDEQRKDTVGG